MTDYTEQENVEYEVENALQEIRSDDFEKQSPHFKDKQKKTVKNGIQFLKDNYPDSYILELDISDN